MLGRGRHLGRGLPLQSLGLVRRHGVLVLPRGSGLPGVAGAPPAGGWRRVSAAARQAESPPIASPWGAAAAVPPSGTERSTADRGRRLRWANHAPAGSASRRSGRSASTQRLRPGCGTGGAKRTGRGGETSRRGIGCVGSADNGAHPPSGGFGGRTGGRATHRRRGAPDRRESRRHPPGARRCRTGARSIISATRTRPRANASPRSSASAGATPGRCGRSGPRRRRRRRRSPPCRHRSTRSRCGCLTGEAARIPAGLGV